MGLVMHRLQTGRHHMVSRVRTGQSRTLRIQRDAGGVCGLHVFHRVRGTDALLKTELAQCRFPADVSVHLERLMAGRLDMADKPCDALESILE